MSDVLPFAPFFNNMEVSMNIEGMILKGEGVGTIVRVKSHSSLEIGAKVKRESRYFQFMYPWING